MFQENKLHVTLKFLIHHNIAPNKEFLRILVKETMKKTYSKRENIINNYNL